jgi:lipoate-protein ligase A
MLTVEVIVQPDLHPVRSQALDLELLNLAAQHGERAWLRVYSLAGDAVSLGRYHVAPTGDPHGRIAVHRRLGGGRVVPLGPGFTVLSLTLPHRSALLASEPLALRPEQALNRWVRALLAGLRGLGVDAFYPGRDRITVGRRVLGSVSLESDAQGATAFEVVLAMDGDWLCLPERVAVVDRDGVLAAEVLSAADVTNVASHARAPILAELAHCVAGSLAQQFGVELAAGAEPVPRADSAERAAAWVASRRLRPELDRHGIAWGQLGVVEVHLAMRASAIADVLLAGDFIADSASIAQLEQRLRGCPLDAVPLAAAVDAVYADPHAFLLGIGAPRTIVDTILSAA